MLPYIELWGRPVSTSALLAAAMATVTLAVLLRAFGRDGIPPHRHVLLVAAVAAAALLGARAFYVAFVDPELLRDPSPGELLRFRGMVFYGGLAAGVPAFALAVRALYPSFVRDRLWDLSTVMLAASYGTLRIGCLANGCCWGRICEHRWAVIYENPDSSMPYLGIPVHPVQLYDSMGGFLIAAALAWLYRRAALRGSLFLLFCLLYAVTRFATEAFRGDAYRGEDFIGWLSMSQSVSAGLFAAGAVTLAGLHLRGAGGGARP